MLNKFVRLFLISFLLIAITFAQQNKLKVSRMVFAKNVKDAKPVSVDTSFSNTVEKVYCFTKIGGAQDTTAISHVWYYNNKQMAEVNLDIKSKSWRTWSFKKILKDWTGKWRVEVLDSDDDILEKKEFKIEE